MLAQFFNNLPEFMTNQLRHMIVQIYRVLINQKSKQVNIQ